MGISKRSIISIILLTAVLSGCNVTQEKHDDESFNSLLELESLIIPQGLPKSAWSGMKDDYLKATKSDIPEVRAAALQRLADLALEEAEENLLTYSDNQNRYSKNRPAYYDAIDGYKQLLHEYPNRDANDVILYQLARAYDYAGDSYAVLATLGQLTEDFVQSPLYAESQFRRGELLFTMGKFSPAAKAYNAIVNLGDTNHFYKHALYKLAWADYRKNDINQARETFSQLLGYLNTSDTIVSVKLGNQELAKDSLRVLSLSFSEDGEEQRIQQFFTQIGEKPFTPLVYKSLADLYITQKRYGDAGRVLEFFAKENSSHTAAPYYLLDSIANYEKARMHDKAIAARIELANIFAVKSDVWSGHEKAHFVQVKPYLKENIVYLAKYYHADFQQSPQENQQSAKYAQHWYQFYLESFPTEPEAASVHFLLAENLFETNSFKAAAEAYEQVAYHYPQSDDASEAGYAALLSQEKRSDVDDAAKRLLLIASAEQFLKAFPNDQRAITVRLKQIDQYLAQKDYASVVKSGNILLAESLKLNKSQTADILEKLSVCHFALGNFAQAETTSEQALRYLDSSSKSYSAIYERLAASIYKQGEEAQANNLFQQAADHYLRVAQKTPKSDIKEQSDYDGATALISAAMWEKALKVLNNFVHVYQHGPLQYGAHEKLAYVYNELGDSEKAAETYESLVKLEADPEKKAMWRRQAADGYEQANNFAKALSVLAIIGSNISKTDDEYYLTQYKIAEINKKLGHQTAYIERLTKLINDAKNTSQSPMITHLAAKASLNLAELKYSEFMATTLSMPLKLSLKKKKTQMEQAIQAYKDATQFNIAEVTTASTYYIAEIYRELSVALLNSERPKKMDSDELEMYDLMVEEQAFPFEEKAITIHKTNTIRINHGIYDKWVKKSFKALAELEPVKYQKNEKQILMVKALD